MKWPFLVISRLKILFTYYSLTKWCVQLSQLNQLNESYKLNDNRTSKKSVVSLITFVLTSFSKVYQMFAMFFPKKVAEQDLKIIIFLFVDNDCFTNHNLDPHFFDEKWAFKNKARLLFLKTSFSKVYQMFAMFFPKKVAKQDLKIIIFLFVDIDCYTIHNLDPYFFDEKWAFKNKARLLFSKTSFSKVYQMFALFFPKKLTLQDLKIIICMFDGNDCFLAHISASVPLGNVR